jgi:PIN domain nuclease of toxin-antitoxin system
VKILIDSHVLIWMLGDPSRIPPKSIDVLNDRHTEILVSAVTAFEISTKHRIGKLNSAEALVHNYADYLARLGAKELPVTSHHGIVAGQLSWAHRDPFDRIIVAQSMTESLPLVTADAIFADVAGVRTLWA